MNSSTEAVTTSEAGTGNKQKSFTKSVFYPHSPERVWVALTDPRALAEWLMPNNFEPRLGCKFRFQTDPQPGCGNGITDCEVIEFDPPRRMTWLWTSWLKNNRAGGPMHIEWELAPEEGGTRLTLRQTGLEVLPWYMRPMMTFGWGTMLKRWVPKVVNNVGNDGSFTPGAIPLNKRCYKVSTLPDDLVY